MNKEKMYEHYTANTPTRYINMYHAFCMGIEYGLGHVVVDNPSWEERIKPFVRDVEWVLTRMKQYSILLSQGEDSIKKFVLLCAIHRSKIDSSICDSKHAGVFNLERALVDKTIRKLSVLSPKWDSLLNSAQKITRSNLSKWPRMKADRKFDISVFLLCIVAFDYRYDNFELFGLYEHIFGTDGSDYFFNLWKSFNWEDLETFNWSDYVQCK